jgi:hypothetical protein
MKKNRIAAGVLERLSTVRLLKLAEALERDSRKLTDKAFEVRCLIEDRHLRSRRRF